MCQPSVVHFADSRVPSGQFGAGNWQTWSTVLQRASSVGSVVGQLLPTSWPASIEGLHDDGGMPQCTPSHRIVSVLPSLHAPG
jgi:hypothetical protein